MSFKFFSLLQWIFIAAQPRQINWQITSISEPETMGSLQLGLIRAVLFIVIIIIVYAFSNNLILLK